jgi:HEPN domain-containing protein
MSKITLHQRFFEAAQIDLDSSKALIDKGLFQPAIYHLQQAYEKSIKAYFIFKEVKFNNTPEATVYDNILKLGHDTEESTIALLKDFADLEIRDIESQLPGADANRRVALQNKINVLQNKINSHKSSLDRYVQRIDLRTNFIKNVPNYSQLVKEKYDGYLNSKISTSKQPEMNFFATISSMANLYPCFYKMELVTRYPLKEFAYDNLNLLTNLGQSCQSLVEMLQELISLISPDLR